MAARTTRRTDLRGVSGASLSGQPREERRDKRSSAERRDGCEACNNTGLKDASTFCEVCNGSPWGEPDSK